MIAKEPINKGNIINIAFSEGRIGIKSMSAIIQSKIIKKMKMIAIENENLKSLIFKLTFLGN